MKILQCSKKIRDVYEGYVDNAEDGVVASQGKLNIRPPYQREFIYKDNQRDEVIRTINKGFPLNTMYWAKDGDNYELLDGQQRTLSICQYIHGDFSVDMNYFHTLPKDLQDKILDYELMIYICEGEPSEKLGWFEIINIAGEELTKQELRNAQYTSEWLIDAKRHFSKTGCPAYQIGEKYMNGTPIRQEYLETVLRWICDKENMTIEDYMGKQKKDGVTDANALWMYYQSVLNWVRMLFPTYRKEMKGIEWGILYNKYKDQSYNSDKMENLIKIMMMDDEVSKKSGIYVYLITGDEKYLNLRAFTPAQKIEVYEKQNGICPICKNHFDITEMEADHITPWSQGGKTDIDNCQMLCRECNRRKSDK